ncbi:MAG: dockerin type I repeat-containing protein [Clostridia bacterium]|nr:dockerin type I repeat-containing protein [Clostridia bacterium]
MHGILKHKKIISLVLVFAVFMFLFAYGTDSTGGNEIFQNCELISAGKGNFLFITYNEKTYCTYKIDKNGNMSQTSSNNFTVKSAFFANSHLFFIGVQNQSLPVVKFTDGGAYIDSGFITVSSLKEHCITAAKYDYIYAVDSKNPDTVYKYQIDNGKLYGEYKLGKNIKSLFTDSNNIVFAITDGGIFNVETGGFISCNIPSVPYDFSGNYCCDSSGKIFVFNGTSGFKPVMQTGYSKLCVINDTIYAAENNIVYILDDSGKPKYKYQVGSDIQKLCVSGNTAAVMYGNNVQILHKEDFDLIIEESSNDIVSEISQNIEPSKPVYTQSSEPSKNSEPVSQQSQNSVTQNSEIKNSTPQNSEIKNPTPQNNSIPQKQYGISSSKYRMNNGIITNIPQGTTIAQLKKNISYGSNSITITNHNNKIQTSGQVGTGWRIDFSGNGKTTSYYTVISGDVTGEGNINSRDILALSDYLLEKSDLSVYAMYAADLNSDGMCNSLDLLLLKQKIS